MPRDSRRMTPAPRHRPYLTAGAAFEIGLKPMDPAQWLDVGPDHAAFMAAKRARLVGCPPLYYRTLERSHAAQHELLSMAVSHLLDWHGDAFEGDQRVLADRIDGSCHDLGAGGREPLEVLGGIIEEDFVLFGREEGRDIVIAASNAYTSWAASCPAWGATCTSRMNRCRG